MNYSSVKGLEIFNEYKVDAVIQTKFIPFLTSAQTFEFVFHRTKFDGIKSADPFLAQRVILTTVGSVCLRLYYDYDSTQNNGLTIACLYEVIDLLFKFKEN